MTSPQYGVKRTGTVPRVAWYSLGGKAAAGVWGATGLSQLRAGMVPLQGGANP